MTREELENTITSCEQSKQKLHVWPDAIRELITSLRAIATSLSKRNVIDGRRALLRVVEQAEPLNQYVAGAVEVFEDGFDMVVGVAEDELLRLDSAEEQPWR